MRGKYRGKRIDNGEWVYGSLISDRFIVGDVIEWNEDYFNTEWWCAVDPATVGQYTGLPDSNRQELFEGDKWQYHGVVYVVTWHPDKANFYFKHPSPNAYDDDHIEMEWSTHGQKVGNRWDTPEGRTET